MIVNTYFRNLKKLEIYLSIEGILGPFCHFLGGDKVLYKITDYNACYLIN